MTYRIKKLKGADGFTARPVDKQVSQWNAERDAKTNTMHLEAEAFPPAHIYLKNDVYPREHEIYNCTSCSRGRELPANKLSTTDYHYYCRWDMKTHIGPKNAHGLPLGDNGCQMWSRKVKIPHKGYMEGVER